MNEIYTGGVRHLLKIEAVTDECCVRIQLHSGRCASSGYSPNDERGEQQGGEENA
jgi:hypothetical protein